MLTPSTHCDLLEVDSDNMRKHIMMNAYSHEQAQQILRHASMLKQSDPVTREQLTEITAEVGISSDLLHQAEQSWLLEQQSQRRQAGYRLGFQLHLIPYLIVSVLMVLLNLSTTPRIFWSIYPIFGWGIGVTAHGLCIARKK